MTERFCFPFQDLVGHILNTNFLMKDKITPQELNNSLNALDSTPIQIKEPSYNILIIKTNRGKMTVKTHLSKEEWIAEQELKLKNLPSRKKKKRK